MAESSVKYQCNWDLSKHKGRPCPKHHLKSEGEELYASTDSGQSYDLVTKDDYDLLKDAGYLEDNVDLTNLDIKIIQETEQGKNEAEEHEFYIEIDGKRVDDVYYTPDKARKGLKELLNKEFDLELTDDDIDEAVGIKYERELD